jgi:hypothetical protein
MKKILVLTALLWGCGAAFAQNSPFKIKLSQADEFIQFRMDQISASITGYDGDEIIIEALPEPNKQVPEEAKGLKLMPIPGRNVNSYAINPRIREADGSLQISIPQGAYQYLSIKVPQTAMMRVEMHTNLVNGRLIVKNVNHIQVWGFMPLLKISEVSSFDILTFGSWNDPQPINLRPDMYGKVTMLEEYEAIKKPTPNGSASSFTHNGKTIIVEEYDVVKIPTSNGVTRSYTAIENVSKVRVNGKDYTAKKDIDSLLKAGSVDAVEVNKTADAAKKMKINGKTYTGDNLPAGVMNLPAYIIDKMPGGGSIIISDIRWSNSPMIINGHAYPHYYDISANHADIDLSVPDDINAHLIFYSAKGQVYSGFNINPVNASDEDIKFFTSLFHMEAGIKTVALNGSGIRIPVTLQNNTGNIYLRKQK